MSSLDFIFLLQALSTLRACCNWLLSSRDLYGFHLVFYSSKSFLYGVFPSGAEYCFNMLRPYHVTCYKHTVYMYILQQYLWKGEKKKTFYGSGRQIDYLKKKVPATAVFNSLISYCIHVACVLKTYFWKSGKKKRHFFSGILTREYQEQKSLSCIKWWAKQACSWSNSLK